MRLSAILFPDPARRIPAHRALAIAFRTVHLAGFGVLLGGHLFDVDPARLVPWLAVTLASGAALMALELAASFAWLSMTMGVAVLVKLVLLALVLLFWEHRVAILLLVVVIASVTSHMPSRLRHYQLIPRLRAAPVAPAAPIGLVDRGEPLGEPKASV